MTARQQRRMEERKTRKGANKAAGLNHAAVQSPESDGFESQKTAPVPEAKNTSTLNRFTRGVAGKFVVLDWENTDLYHEMLIHLHDEHQPQTMTEYLLVERMAQHQWLAQRAIRLQHFCFHQELPTVEQEEQLALYLRYGTTHDRAFHKCLADLLKLRAQKTKEQRGFESQKRQEAAETRKQEFHDAKRQATLAKKTCAPPPIAVSAIPEVTPKHLPDGLVPQNSERLTSEHLAKAA